ncbi:MAG: O-antigen ligase family protein [Rubrivivax sp.]|nr:O-antigen ligase family protein [Rubrivivax sp.]
MAHVLPSDLAPAYLWALLPAGLYITFVPLLSDNLGHIGGHDLARLAEILLGIVCALVLVVLPRRRFVVPGSAAQPALIGALLVLALASAALAAQPRMAFRELAVLTGLIAVVLVIAETPRIDRVARTVVCFASALYVCVITLIIIAATIAGQEVNRAELFVGYDNYRFYNHVQTAALPLTVMSAALASFSAGNARWMKIAAWVASAGGFAMLYATMGRGTLVGIAVAAIVVTIAFRSAALPLMRTLAIAAVAGAVYFVFLFFVLPLMVGVAPAAHADFYGAREGSAQVRLMLWGIALEHVRSAPWLGIGPMHYAHYPTGDASHPHNIYLQIAAEFGIPALLLMLTLTVIAARRFSTLIRACRDPEQRLCGMGLYLACIAVAIDGLFSGNFVMPVSQVWIAFTLGWSLAWMRGQGVSSSKQAPNTAGASMRWRLPMAVMLALQLWLVVDVWPEAIRLEPYLHDAMNRFPSPTMNPRFWSHGWF